MSDPAVGQTGGAASHTVTIAGHTSAVTSSAGGSGVTVTVKFIPSAIVPGSLGRLGVGL